MVDLDQKNENSQSNTNVDSNDAAPMVGLEFDSLDDAWELWREYGKMMGFGVRKEYQNRSKKDKVVTNAVYVCTKYGHRQEDKRARPDAKHRWDWKCDCKVRLNVSLDRETGKYKVKEFVDEHNHYLEHALAVDTAHDSGITSRAIHELLSREAGGKESVGLVMKDQKRHLRSKKERNMEHGELGSVLEYFEKQKKKNMVFDYSLQLDEEEKVTNIFWLDAGMIVDYDFFGDVVVFDTTFGTNKQCRPLGIFTGFNHHREVVLFGAALLYDETLDSFVWLFETFINAHGGKKPKTIFTDQDAAMASALEMVLSDTKHGLCSFHIMQNAVKHLGSCMKSDSELLGDFRRCMYEYVDEIDFEHEWLNLLEKHSMKDNEWLKHIYTLKEKWAKCFMRHNLTLGIQSSQLSESLNKDFKSCLERKLNIEDFFKLFDRVLEQKRKKEVEAEFHARQVIPSLGNEESTLLQQASKRFTPSIFKLFQKEFMLASRVKICDRDVSQILQKYIVILHGSNEKEYTVLCDQTDGTVTCSCKKFESEGIMCCHSLKVYSILDIMDIPENYILSRWTRGIKSGYVVSDGKSMVEEDRHAWHKRINALFLRMSYQASMDKITRAFVDNMVNAACKEVFEFAMGNEVTEVKEIDNNVKNILGSMKELKKKVTEKGIKRARPGDEECGPKTKQVTSTQTSDESAPLPQASVIHSFEGFSPIFSSISSHSPPVSHGCGINGDSSFTEMVLGAKTG